MSKLFETPTDELRETYVRTCFSHADRFDRPDIEDWLRQQWKSSHPNQSMTGFGRFSELIERYVPYPLTVEHLDQYATPIRQTGNWQKWLSGASPEIRQIILGLMKVGAKLYRTSNGGPVFVLDRTAYVVKPNNKIAILDAPAFLDVLFSEWRCGTRKASATREFICYAMYEEIAIGRATLERSFNEACAVSTNATVIIYAKWVFVRSDEDPKLGWLFEATVFEANKVRFATLPSSTIVDLQWVIDAQRCYGRGQDLDNVLKVILSRWPITGMYDSDILFVRDPRRSVGGFDTMLLTSRRYCPSPLPEGGREIRVL